MSQAVLGCLGEKKELTAINGNGGEQREVWAIWQMEQYEIIGSNNPYNNANRRLLTTLFLVNTESVFM